MSDEQYPPLVKIDKILSLDLKSQKKSTKENIYLVNLIGEAVCYNQLMLAQYYCLLGQKHKALKEKFIESSHDRNALQQLYSELENYSYNTLRTVVSKNFGYALRSFQDRSPLTKPRVCLKLVSGETVISAFRDRKSSLDEKYYNKSDNTAFRKICMGEPYYICNNVPEQAKKSLYVNARIVNKEKLSTYREPNILNNVLSRIPTSIIHTNWKDCWEKIDADPSRTDLSDLPPETCYKSTLVIPLSLKREELDQSFINQFDSIGNTRETERLIFGFLCFDHQEIKFFNETSDVKIGYIFADILSLYLMARKTYTDCSTTFERMKLDFSNE
jgi:hypothetical protein